MFGEKRRTYVISDVDDVLALTVMVVGSMLIADLGLRREEKEVVENSWTVDWEEAKEMIISGQILVKNDYFLENRGLFVWQISQTFFKCFPFS